MAGQNSALLLSRAGEILQEIFYLYKEKIFLKKVTSIEVKGDKIYIEVENVDNTTQITKLPTFAELLQACPSKNKCGSNGVKKAVATYDASSDAVAWMHDMVKYMLDDIAVKIEEVSVQPKHHKRQVIPINVKKESQQEATSNIYHDIFKVEIENGKCYALDLAGAQFGHYDPLTPWDDYLRTRVEKVTERENWEQYRYFGGLKAYHKKEVDDLSSLDKFQFSQYAGVNMCASERLEEVTLAWMEAKKLRCFKAMLNLPQEEFQAMKKGLLEMVAEELEAFVVRTKKNLGPLKGLRNARGCAPQ